jgi:PAS domain S-box-containing protein
VVEQSPVSVVITDLRGTIEYVNPKFCAVTGYSVEEVRGKNPRVLKSGEMAGESYQKLWATITNGQEWRGEFHNRKKNGELFWESASIGPVRDANGKTTHFIAIKEDITTRKRALEDLAEAKQFLDQIIDTVGDPLFVKDRRHRWVMMNAANCALIGHTRQELLGKTNRDFFPPEEADRFWARDEEVFNTGRESIHEEIITDGAGNVHIVQTHKNLYRNEQGDQFIVGVLRDITQGKKLEAALRESEHRQRAVLDNIPDPAWLRDREGRFLMVNRAWCNVAGITPADAVGKTVVEVGVFPPEIARNIQAEDEEVISLGTSSQRELQLNSKNHGPVWFETLKTALVDERGTIVGLVGIARDITDRKRADAVQKEQIALRERLAKVAMNAPGVIYSLRLRLDGSACMPYVSPTVEEFYGVRAEEVMENAALVFTLVHPDDQAQIRESILESARQMAPWRAEFRVNHPRKGLFWVGNRSTPEREIDGGTLWHGFMSDITERKRAEEALRESEEKFRQLADNTTDVFWICSPDFKTIHYVSAGYELIWGVSRESLYAHPHQWREAILPEERVRLATVFARLQGNASTVSVEYPITRRDGTVRWIHDRGFQVRDAAGNLIRLAGIASDITEQRRAAQELAERKESEELVRCELAHEHALNMIKSRFVSMVSHEFRTPLCAINMAAFMLTDYGEGMPGEERMEHARTIQRSVGRMTGMMEDFLTHDRVQTGKSECTPAWMNVESFCQELVPEVVNPLSPNRLVDLSIEPAAREAWLDEKILRHILTNLLSNAVKYSGDRQPVTIEVKRMEDGIPTSGGPRSAARDGLQFRVTDAGIGIPEADLGKLYQTFHRAANVGNRPGTGMGLAIVKQFVDLHGGTIRVESHVGQGTTFWVWLPAVALTMPGKAAAAVPAGESKEAGINGK